MRRQFLLASVGALALTGSALSAELPPAPPPTPIFTWTGLYVGGQIGGAWGRDPTALSFFAPGFGLVETYINEPSGVIGGAHIGYNLQINQWVAGIEGTVDGTSLNSTRFGPITGVSVRTREQVQGSIRARLGIAFDRVLIYGTGGAAFTGIENDYTDSLGFFAFPGTLERISRTRSGWTAGGGIAYAITNNWSIRAEYRYSDFGRYTDFPFAAASVLAGGLLSVQHHLTQHQVQFGVSYKFDFSPLAPVVARF